MLACRGDRSQPVCVLLFLLLTIVVFHPPSLGTIDTTIDT